ncbi:sigma 54-interacting transcriptional regulator [Cognatishimia sp. SS12]|uniref:sigma-54-dependent Fis family transcriptional regulator n=1 Tax=Cognatishimia sp. SS12 TaxID=2979465 RepID=UPI00232B1DEC|nr:GAF domain-containing protein [Cognatishimia sp. SS12]MDC0738326.1 sigma 54-interacting transcriptional regulator [Cognatishimia sp. SS12]
MFLKARAALETKGRFASGAVPEQIADSWHRCLQYGLDPVGEPVDADIGIQALRETRQKHEQLLRVVRPELELLSTQIAGTNHMTAFADHRGVVLETIMDTEFSLSKCARSVRCGTIWDETHRGTNALGLALYSGRTSMVTGGEHYFSSHGQVSCVSTPIFDSQGEIVGLLDASSEVAARQFHTQALVELAASNIENRLFVEDHRGNIIVQFHPREEYLKTQSVGMISFNEQGTILGANRRAAAFLNGLDVAVLSKFRDLFRTDFSTNLKAMQGGETVRLVDWLNSAFFARIRLSRRSAGPSAQNLALNLSSTYDVPSLPDAPVFRDEQVLNSLKLAIRSAMMMTPQYVIGATGTGRTTFVQAVHHAVCPDKPLIAVDCRAASLNAETDGLTGELFGGDENSRFLVETGGMLVLEDLSEATGRVSEQLAQLINRLLQHKSTAKWSILVVESATPEPQAHWSKFVSMTFAKLSQLEFQLPPLCERTDAAYVAISMMSRLSAEHQLSRAAIEAIFEHHAPATFYELEKLLTTLAIQCPATVLRAEHVNRYILRNDTRESVCPRCKGSNVKEAKCREINRLFQECNANIALAARKLGVSRNTVYAHTQSEADAL